MRASPIALGTTLILLLFAALPAAAQDAPPESPKAAEEPLELLLPDREGEERSSWPLGKPHITGRKKLEALLSGRTHYRSRSDGSSEIEFHSEDGISAYLWDSCVQRGSWWATEEEVCFYYPDTELKGPHCFYLVDAEEGVEFWWIGDVLAPSPTAINVRDVPGNAANLPIGVSGECLVS